MASQSTSESLVARIAYLSSDVVVSVTPSLDTPSGYAPTLRALASDKVQGVIGLETPQIHTVRHNADPLLSALAPARSGKLTTITTTSPTLLPSIPHLYKLAQYPVVIHVSLTPSTYPDYQDITSIRQSGLILLQSETPQESQDIAAAAHALAIKSGKAVLHFFVSREGSAQGDERELLQNVLDVSAARSHQLRTTDSTSLYADDGVRAQTTRVLAQEPQAVEATIPAGTAPATTAATQHSTTATSSATPTSQDSQKDTISSLSSTDSTVIKRAVTSDDILAATNTIFQTIQSVTGRKYDIFEYTGPANAEAVIVSFGSSTAAFRNVLSQTQYGELEKVGLLSLRLYRPWYGTKVSEYIPKSVTKVAVLEQIKRKTTKWGPLFIDLVTVLRSEPSIKGPRTVVGYQLAYVDQASAKEALGTVVRNLRAATPEQNLIVGQSEAPLDEQQYEVSQPKVEAAYTKILAQLFGDKIHIANALDKAQAGVPTETSARPEFGYGALLARLEARENFIKQAEYLAKTSKVLPGTAEAILKWILVAEDSSKSAEAAKEVEQALESDGSAAAKELLGQKEYLKKESQWLVGSDAWSYDLGNSGVHHVLASGKNVNMLIIDSTPYSEHAKQDAARRKKDVGLYAMNYGNAYVASVAVYSSYTQVLHALIEAEKFDGPSVVLAYLPYHGESDSPLAILQETKKAVDIGYWPLYRWNPYGAENGEDNFHLDSERIKNELKEFLKRDNHLTALVRRNPVFAANVDKSYGTEVRDQQKRAAKDAYTRLLEGVSGPPLTILFASDGSNAEGLAKRLERRAKARGLKAITLSMEDYPIEDLASEENVVFFTATAGQGEFPQNGRAFWEHLKDSTDIDLQGVNFSVFALGDSLYWPRKEDKIYYNKPGKDLNKRLNELSGNEFVPLGLGDDQDPDGYQTGYAEWEPKLWTAMGVDKVEGLADEPPPITNEDIKIASNFLRGTIKEGLADESTGALGADDCQLTKFHGTYMQDDRDLREERKAQGLEPAYSFMIRCRLAGGVATPRQWLQMDDISSAFGNETMKLTTRQTFQFHGVIKRNLRGAMRAINRALMTTIAACGDVNRNVMCSSLPQNAHVHAQVQECAARIDTHLLPSTTAYHEIWLKDEDADKRVLVAGNAVQDFEPLYGPTYLPRKFKITIAIPPHNDTDVYAHDIGLIAIVENNELKGFNMLVGGGMGVTHNNKKTYPRTGSMMGFVSKEDVHIACEKVMLVQRDNGDRKNRKHARLKYTVDDMTIEGFKAEVEKYWGKTFDAPRDFKFDSNVDAFGWQQDERGLWHFTFFIENGRIEDTADFKMRTGLREIAKVHKGEFRLTGNQHLILSNVASKDLEGMKALMKEYGLDNTNFSALRLSSSACVAFPTCGLAMAESERYLPVLISKVEKIIFELGLGKESIVMRMTGCPNGCARPWLAEIGFVGKAFGAYNMYLGGGYHGQRLSKLYRSSIKEEEILEILNTLLRRYVVEREQGEHFGDWTIRAGIVKETRQGKEFHDDVAEEDTEE
ncbi:sulfite reductase-like protein subunit beta [Ascobolus immersus RN42]|uniref:Sulfite reductase [NADPH] subunit beta n=1 Tax=Ascobolus immersus RN42 TaxID=1160509 RepID=A0A3N4HDN8_ASCIM|nr:sulfite reductase-like protein subunit beta [Ascobolus immersus RN42]